MREYLKIQYLMIMRKLSDGSRPIVGYLLALFILFIFTALSSVLLNSKITFAPYIYTIISLFFTSRLSEVKRNDFLKTCFKHRQYIEIRILENLITALPFVVLLVCKQHFYLTAILVAITILMALLNFKVTYNITIPTPFYKQPFEFIVGFRNTFYIFLIAYGLAIVAVISDNFNLGVFSLLSIFLTILSYYSNSENEYFVWSYTLTPAKFLINKIKIALLFSFCLCLPIFSLLSIFYFDHIGILLICIILGWTYLITIILIKYSVYPNEMNLAQVIIMGLCLAFPPMLIAIIPFSASKSINSLKDLLK